MVRSQWAVARLWDWRGGGRLVGFQQHVEPDCSRRCEVSTGKVTALTLSSFADFGLKIIGRILAIDRWISFKPILIVMKAGLENLNVAEVAFSTKFH